MTEERTVKFNKKLERLMLDLNRDKRGVCLTAQVDVPIGVFQTVGS